MVNFIVTQVYLAYNGAGPDLYACGCVSASGGIVSLTPSSQTLRSRSNTMAIDGLIILDNTGSVLSTKATVGLLTRSFQGAPSRSLASILSRPPTPSSTSTRSTVLSQAHRVTRMSTPSSMCKAWI